VIGQVRIRIIGFGGQVKHDCTIGNTIQPVVRNALAAKIRDDTPFPDEYVPNFLSVTSSQMETVYPRIQARAVLADGSMYFFAMAQFSRGDDNTYVYSVGLLSSEYWPIAGAIGSEIDGAFFNPSDLIEVTYTIKLSVSEGNTSFQSSYFQEVSSVMIGILNIIDYEADNSRYVVPNKSKLLGQNTDLIVTKDFVPMEGADSSIGTSEGDLEWYGVEGEVTPYYAQWLSHHFSRTDLVIGTTDLDQSLRDAYPVGTNIETRFSMELYS